MKRMIIVFLALISTVIYAQYEASFTIGSIHANPGEMVSGKLVVEKGIDEGTFIPITIIHGTKPGPILTLIAGVHGTEYVPIVVLQKLLHEIEPEELSGIIVLVHIANIPAFRSMSVVNSPGDNKNLNRVFPGKKDGTISERIAFTISNEIISKSDYFLDLHGGEFNEQIVDYLYFVNGGPDEELCKKSRMLAHATGNHYLIPEDYSLSENQEQGTYSEVAAAQMGVPAITLEWGDRGMVECDVVEFALKGMKNVMCTLGMINGDPIVYEYPVYVIDEIQVMSNFDGILYSYVNKGQYVSKGFRMGYTTDYWGNVMEEYYAPLSGIVLFLKNIPKISKGEKIYRVVSVADKL